MAELEKLNKLVNLTSFAVHGNPIENLNGFRFYIVAKFPQLKHLNFWFVFRINVPAKYFKTNSIDNRYNYSGVSKAERESAHIWLRSNRHPLKIDTGKPVKKKSKHEED